MMKKKMMRKMKTKMKMGSKKNVRLRLREMLQVKRGNWRMLLRFVMLTDHQLQLKTKKMKKRQKDTTDPRQKGWSRHGTELFFSVSLQMGM